MFCTLILKNGNKLETAISVGHAKFLRRQKGIVVIELPDGKKIVMNSEDIKQILPLNNQA